MSIIDIHTHIYERVAGITRGQSMASTDLGRVIIGNEEVQFLPPSLGQNRSTAEVLIAYMDWYGIEKVVPMPNPYYGYHNRYFVDGMRRYPNWLRGVALVDTMKGQETVREPMSIYDQGILSGLKVKVDSIFQCVPGAHLLDFGLFPMWDYCNQYHQPVFIHMFCTKDIEDTGFLASAYPNISFTLCHMGADTCFKKGMSEPNYREVLDSVKNRPNVSINTPTIPVHFGEEYPWSSSVETIQVCYHHMEPRKIMWASDYPGTLNYGAIQQLINLVEKHCSHIPEPHQQMIIMDNAK